jgi:hypothetical protein
MVIEDKFSIFVFFLGLSNSAVEPKYSLTHVLFLGILKFGPTGASHSNKLSSDSSVSEPSSKILPFSPWSLSHLTFF